MQSGCRDLLVCKDDNRRVSGHGQNVDVDLFSKVFQTLHVDPTERHAFISVSVTYRRVSGPGKNVDFDLFAKIFQTLHVDDTH